MLFCELSEKAQQADRSVSVPVCDEQRALFLYRLSMCREGLGNASMKG